MTNALLSVLAQSSSSYTDSGIVFQGIVESTHGITYGFVLPPTNATGPLAEEFIGEIIVPVVNGWVSLNAIFPRILT